MYPLSAIVVGIGTEIQDGGWHIPIFIDALMHLHLPEALAPARWPVRTSSLVTLLESRDQTAPEPSNCKLASNS